jgi:hypothetical protein
VPFTRQWHQESIPFSLMVSFLMIMGIVLFQNVSEGPFSKQNEPRQDFLFHGSHPSLRIGIQIGAPRRQDNTLNSARVNQVLKRRAELAIAVVEQVLPGDQASPLRHR